MNLTDPAELRALLERHGLTPRKRWGQHFLVSSRAVSTILSQVEGFAGVLEIGPGPGVLTAGLSKRGIRVIALEIDPIAISALQETAPTAQIRTIDVLAADLIAVLDELPKPRAILSNMPYNITGPLLERIAGARHEFQRAVLMMQKEVAAKIMATPGTANYGALSVALQTQFSLRKIAAVPKSAFFPPPKVSSTVLELTPRFVDFKASGEAEFLSFVKKGFRQPRKTVANNLAFSLQADRLTPLAWLAESRYEANIRPHQIDLEGWRTLFEIAKQHGL